MSENHKKNQNKSNIKYKHLRCISSNTFNSTNSNNSSEKVNKTTTSITHHRKISSSYFIDSYLPSLESLIYSPQQENNDTQLINSSFHSYEEINDDELTKDSYNNYLYELEKNNEKINDKSFIQIKNGLKFLIGKEESMTESYLMALNRGIFRENEKKLYLPSGSIIEEEKSEFLESTSKKQTIINNRFLYDKKDSDNENNLINNSSFNKSNNNNKNQKIQRSKSKKKTFNYGRKYINYLVYKHFNNESHHKNILSKNKPKSKLFKNLNENKSNSNNDYSKENSKIKVSKKLKFILQDMKNSDESQSSYNNLSQIRKKSSSKINKNNSSKNVELYRSISLFNNKITNRKNDSKNKLRYKSDKNIKYNKSNNVLNNTNNKNKTNKNLKTYRIITYKNKSSKLNNYYSCNYDEDAISNIKQTEIILKEFIYFNKNYQKNDILKILNKTINKDKSIFIILSNVKKTGNNFSFKGLYKYYENTKKFIKIFGDCPNVINIHDINTDLYKIYEGKINKNGKNELDFSFHLINDFHFSLNSIIICKK